VGSYDYLGTESDLSLKHWPHSPAAVCSLPSLSLQVSRPTSVVALSSAGEEVGADWHMIDRIWLGRESERRKKSYFNIFMGLLFIILLYKIVYGFI